tara:strand:+ start:2184 stop:2825 length:642 start_codon:yes stop_codon:yes gene_type:complete
MRITLFGAAGKMGRRITKEAVNRGHKLTAVVRDYNDMVVEGSQVTVVQGDATNLEDVAHYCASAEVVIAATKPPDGSESQLLESTSTLLESLANTPIRLIISGGAASLQIPGKPNSLLLHDNRYMSESAIAIGKACLDQLNLCRASKNVHWTYLSPSALLVPGERTGNFRLGADELLIDASGRSSISMEDLAVALLDEAEQGQFVQRRFTAGY